MREVWSDPCSFDDSCSAPLYNVQRALCKRHYDRLQRNDQLPPNPSVEEMMVGRWRRITEDGCWEWRGSISPQGYGRWDNQYIHRLSMERLHGPTPPGCDVDHLCRNRRCFNPDHLEVVSHAENLRRGAAAHIIRTGKCINGHKMDQANMRFYVDKRGRTRRICRACARERMRARRTA